MISKNSIIPNRNEYESTLKSLFFVNTQGPTDSSKNISCYVLTIQLYRFSDNAKKSFHCVPYSINKSYICATLK